MDKVRFAVIGTNVITERFIEAASQWEGFQLEGVYSRTIERAKTFAEKYKAPLIFNDLDDLAKSKEIEAVYIASPTAFHKKQACMMLRGRKHVLCEKPMASNALESEAMIQLAEEKRVVLLEGIRNVFTPGYEVIKENLYKIGKIRRATFVYCQYSSRYDNFKEGKAENAFQKDLSNGAIMDIGVYGVHMLVSLFGMPFGVSAKGTILQGSIDGMGTIMVQYKEMQGEIIYSKITNSYLPSEIQGEEGSILFSPIAAPEKIKIILRNGEKETILPDLKKPDLYYEVGVFLDMVKGKRSDWKVFNENSIMAVRIMDDARKQMNIVFPSDF